MRNLRTAGLVIILFAAVAFAAERPNESLSTGEGPTFQCQIGQRLGNEPDSLRLLVAISLPFDYLTFVRGEDGGFESVFEYTITVFVADAALPNELSRKVEVPAANFKLTNSRTKHVTRSEEFVVPPGEHRIRVTLTDLESRKQSRWRGTIDMMQGDSLLEVSDIYWMSEDEELDDLSNPRLVESFSTNEVEARARVEYYSAGANDLHLFWAVFDEKGDTVASRIENLEPAIAVQVSEYTVKLEGLPPQKYTLRFEIDGNGRREIRQRPFGVQLPGLPASIVDLGLAIRQVKYIATIAENRRLRNAPVEDRARLFREFWRKRDPNPETETNELLREYYLRIEYANDAFSTHRSGWETDRGRIFVLYGEPSQIERHPFEPNSRPYEIWFYHQLNRRFTFVDRTGFGDYSLVGPQWGY